MKKLIVFIGILLLAGIAFSHPWGGSFFSCFHARPQYEFRECVFAVKQNPDGRYVYSLTPQRLKSLMNNPDSGRFIFSLTQEKLDSIWNNPNDGLYSTVREDGLYNAFIDELNTQTYSFFNNGKLYMLSYGDDNGFDTIYEHHVINSNWHNNMKVERGLFLFRFDDTGWVKASNKPVQIDYEEIQNGIWSYFGYFPCRIFNENDFGKDAKSGSVIILNTGAVVITLVNQRSDNENDGSGNVKFSNKTLFLIPNGDETYNVQ